MTTITRFTKEQLIKRLEEQQSGARYALSFVQDSEILRDIEMDLRITEIARASLEAEPVAYTEKCEITNMQATGLYLRGFPNNSQGRDIALFTAPPAPVVPEELLSAMEEVLRISDRDHEAWHKARNGIVSCRAAMLQGKAEPVPGWIPCSERMPETDGNYWGWWSESKRQGPVWFIKSDLQAQFQSSEITHWMPLPAAPQQEVK